MVQSPTLSLDWFPELIERDLTDLHQKSSKNNLTKKKRTALYKLKRNCDIVVRQVDKNGNIVVLDANIANKMFVSDADTYLKLHCDPTPAFTGKLKHLVDR